MEVRQIPVGQRPHIVVVTRDARKASVSTMLSDEVSVIDTTAHVVLKSIPVGKIPSHLVVSRGEEGRGGAGDLAMRLLYWHWLVLVILLGFPLLRGQAHDVETPRTSAKVVRHVPREMGAMIAIPAGEFTMGLLPADIVRLAEHFRIYRSWFRREQPPHRVWLPSFRIDMFEVTNQQYREVVRATGHPPPTDWAGLDYLPGRDNHPVVNVSREDAVVFCQWAGKRLPTEQEWEKAARGGTPQAFPWGDNIAVGYANTVEVGRWDTVPVGSFPLDRSPYGVMDMAGNVSEWVADDYRPYPGLATPFGKLDAERVGIGRGGNWHTSLLYARATNRFPAHSHGHPEQGFRCAANP